MTDWKKQSSELLNKQISKKREEEHKIELCVCGCNKDKHKDLGEGIVGICVETNRCMCLKFTSRSSINKLWDDFRQLRESAEEVIAELLRSMEEGEGDPKLWDKECKCGHLNHYHYEPHTYSRAVVCKHCGCMDFKNK